MEFIVKKTLLTVAAASLLYVLAGCSDSGAPTATGTPAAGTSGGVVITATPVVNGTEMPPGTATVTPGVGAPMTETPAPMGTETPMVTATP